MGKRLSAENAALAALGRVLTRGVTVEDRAWMAEVETLAEWASWDLDDLAAEHHRVLSVEVFPVASVFLSERALLGGREAARAAATFERVGFEAPEVPDALGPMVQLAAADPVGGSLLQPWGGAALVAIERQGSVYGAVASLVLEILGERLSGKPVERPGPLRDEAGLRDVARWLCRPQASGWFISRGEIAELARESGFPCGFSSREKMLETWFHTAVEHRGLAEASEVLRGRMTSWNDRSRSLGLLHWIAPVSWLDWDGAAL